jgi:hypothetical protein
LFDIPTGVNIFRQAARSNHVVNQRWLLFTEATPVNDRHAHLQTHAAVILQPLFFYRLKLIETDFSVALPVAVDAACAAHFTGKPFRQSLKKQWYANPGLGGEPDPNRFILFISSIRGSKSSSMSILFITSSVGISSASISARPY